MGPRRLPVALGAALVAAAVGTAAAGIAAPAGADTPVTSGTATTGTATTAVGTVAVDKACYVDTAKGLAAIHITGSGWEPGTSVDLSDTQGGISDTVTTDSTGAFSVVEPAPQVSDPAKHPYISDKIEASDDGTPGTGSQGTSTADSATFDTTNFLALQIGNTTQPSKKTTFSLSGFTPNRTIYAHYLRRGKLVKTVSFGKATGPCGLRKVKTYVYPGGHPPVGSYTIQFDNARGYSKKTTPQYRFGFQIYKVKKR